MRWKNGSKNLSRSQAVKRVWRVSHDDGIESLYHLQRESM
ncbi:hypothetical protein Pla52o_30150 [Novipirellula galeiformis]|uniref:Uncharacterized protein n=1 Tax=Novipirellula galeiformis TaxID=2528004 RepID=A0A5C6CGN2_9BACT|nr:hypothetical protein Pla52o_30150 [Novipirellula galeiformis]